MKDLAMDAQLSGTVRLYDIDKEAAKHNELIGNRISAHPDAKSAWVYKTADTLGEALTGADFVVISILPGTFEEMRSDVHAPEAYGIWHSRCAGSPGNRRGASPRPRCSRSTAARWSRCISPPRA